MENRVYKKKDTNESAWSGIFNFGNFFGVFGEIADAYRDQPEYEAVSTYYICTVEQDGKTGIETIQEGNTIKQTFCGFYANRDYNVYIRPAMWLNTSGSTSYASESSSLALTIEKESAYAIILPEGNTAMNYTKGVYNSIGTIKATSPVTFSDVQSVIVEIKYSGKFINTQDSSQTVSFELITVTT